jgi:hypothetical protein
VEMTDCKSATLAANSVSGGPAPRLHLMPLNQRYALGDIGQTKYLAALMIAVAVRAEFVVIHRTASCPVVQRTMREMSFRRPF